MPPARAGRATGRPGGGAKGRQSADQSRVRIGQPRKRTASRPSSVRFDRSRTRSGLRTNGTFSATSPTPAARRLRGPPGDQGRHLPASLDRRGASGVRSRDCERCTALLGAPRHAHERQLDHRHPRSVRARSASRPRFRPAAETSEACPPGPDSRTRACRDNSMATISTSGWKLSTKAIGVVPPHNPGCVGRERIKPPHYLDVLLRHRPPSISARPTLRQWRAPS